MANLENNNEQSQVNFKAIQSEIKQDTNIKHLENAEIIQQPFQHKNSQKNRYAKDWDTYSKVWKEEFASSYSHLGDEWNDDGTPDRKRDNLYFTLYAERFIYSDMTVLEVGPGGGKWTVRLAPKVKKLIVLDVSEEMLQRTKFRCESLDIHNVEYILANGQDFQPIPNDSIDFFFSYDVFVHIALEDTFPYTQEMFRVLKSEARGICHYAINSVSEAWERIRKQNDWYRGNKHTLGQFYYFSPESLRRMFEYCGLIVNEQHQEGYHCTCVFQKPREITRELAKIPQNSAEIEQLRLQFQQICAELEQAKSTIQAMESSKFWKLRNFWWRLKRTT
jgi:ubiquinone/menaquinone biosynthesis C-methylase UbiE